MTYERLTNRKRFYEDEVIDMDEIYERLAELEDMIESSQLIEPPCKVGDILYGVGTLFMDEVVEETVNAIIIQPNGIQIVTTNGKFPAQYIGVILFYEQKEAEAKLKELKGEK